MSLQGHHMVCVCFATNHGYRLLLNFYSVYGYNNVSAEVNPFFSHLGVRLRLSEQLHFIVAASQTCFNLTAVPIPRYLSYNFSQYHSYQSSFVFYQVSSIMLHDVLTLSTVCLIMHVCAAVIDISLGALKSI